VVATDANGNIYLSWASSCADFGCLGIIDFGGGPTNAAAIVKLDPSGNFVWERRLPEAGEGFAVNARGESVCRSWFGNDNTLFDLTRVDPGGSQAWAKESREIFALGIDPDGNVLVGADYTQGTDPIFGRSFATSGPVVVKL